MFVGYFAWHYSYAYIDGYRIFIDGTRFLWRYFSFDRLGRTLARPLGSGAERGFFIRTISRIVGILIRSGLIILGGMSMGAWWLLVAGAAVVWPFLPIVTAGGLAASFIGLTFAP